MDPYREVPPNKYRLRSQTATDVCRVAGGQWGVISASWYVFPADGSSRAEGFLVLADEDVAELVTMLADPAAGTATLYLSGTGVFATPPIYDHTVHAAVGDGYGYLSHWDLNNDLAYSRGEPDSPGLASEREKFPAGSGLSLASFRAALTELLHTGQRPSAVEWAGAA